MTAVRKFLMLALMVLFAPSAVLASAPVVLCTHQDGSQKFELVHAKLCATQSRKSWRAETGVASAKSAFKKQSCRDSKFFSSIQPSRASTPTLVGGSSPQPAVYDAEVARRTSDLPTESIFLWTLTRLDPRIAHRATTVLLI